MLRIMEEQPRPSALARSRDLRRRGVIVVHGIGEQRRGETLNYIGRPLVDFVEDNLGPEYELRKDVRFNPEKGSATARLHFVQMKGEDSSERIVEEEWTIVEAWWARSFIASAKDELLVWALVLGWRRMSSIFYGFVKRFFAGFGEPTAGTSERAARWLSRPLMDRDAAAVPWPGAAKAHVRTPRPRHSRVWDLLLGSFWLIALLLVYLLSFAVLPIIYLLGGLPGLGGLMGRVQDGFSDFLVDSLGDQHAMTRNRLARDSASNTVLDQLRPWVDPTSEAFAPFDSVTVVAHSGGGVPALDAVTSPELRGWLGGLASAGLPAPAMTLYTLGSGINAAFEMEPDSSLWTQPFPVDLRWVDLWTQYDPVAAGPIDPRVARPVEFVDLRVSNHDNPFSDHSAYFSNQTEVLPRVLDGVLRGKDGPASLRQAVDGALEGIGDHRRRVAWRAVFLPAALLGVLAVALWLGLISLLATAAYDLALRRLAVWLAGEPRATWALVVAALVYMAWRLAPAVDGWLKVRAAQARRRAKPEPRSV